MTCANAADLVEHVGANTGLIPRSKIGDFVVTLSPESATAGATIVVEAKESASYSLRMTLDEADAARRNRGASVCLFIHSHATAGSDIPDLQRWGNTGVPFKGCPQDASDGQAARRNFGPSSPSRRQCRADWNAVALIRSFGL